MNVSINDYIGLFEDAVSLDLCNRIIEEFEISIDGPSSNPDLISNNSVIYGGKTRRNDISLFFNEGKNRNNLCQEINENLDKCLNIYLDEYPGLGMENFTSVDIKVQRTPPKGGYHLWHSEHGLNDSKRCLVWTIYLNNISEGQGETEFLHQALRVHPKAGLVCLFPASWTHVHRGNLTLTETKYIATGWYRLI